MNTVEEKYDQANKKLNTYLKKEGKRQTPERREVLQAICKKEGAFEVMELGTNLTQATLYNTVNLFMKCGILARSINYDNKNVFNAAKFELKI